jgi:hypothetical protein
VRQFNADLFNRTSRRAFLAGGAAAALLRGRASAAHPGPVLGVGHTAEQIARRDAANLAASLRRRSRVTASYQPLDAGIVHIFGYGQSLSSGYLGLPILSTTQPYDNLMIGNATRAAENLADSTTWIPLGSPGAGGIYPFNPMVATQENPNTDYTPGETPGEGAVNYFRRAYLQQLGLPSNSACRFVLTNCGIGGKTIAELSRGANPDIYNRLLNAASYVQQTAQSLGLSYQVGAMIWTQGEQDVQDGTSYASYLASLQQLQADFLADVVQGIAKQAQGVTIPWFSAQPDWSNPNGSTDVYQAILDWANTPGSNFYLAGPLFQYPDHGVHLTSNGYRWHGNQVGRAMTDVLLNRTGWNALYMTGATVSGSSILVDLNVPVPPVILGEVYNVLEEVAYPSLGFEVIDSGGILRIESAAIVGQATIQIVIGRRLKSNPVVQSGFNRKTALDWGTNICDSDATLGQSDYLYVPGLFEPGEDITSWNGAPLINTPYPLNNYLAVSRVPITAG